MTNAKFRLKNVFRLALFVGMFVTTTSLLTACGETTTTETDADTVTTEPMVDPAPVIDTATVDTGRAVMDPKKPDGEVQ